MNYPDPSLDSPITPTCGKCFKLNRITGMCERYDKPLESEGKGIKKVFKKCEECVNRCHE